MASKEKIKQILADKEKLSIQQISKKYNLPKKEVRLIIASSDKNRQWWFYIIMFLIPVVFIILLEVLLRAASYGYNTSQWVDAANDKYVINPELGRKYFNSINFLPITNEDLFDQQKNENAFRIFVLGESSALGYPYMPLGSFPQYLRRRLELVYPAAQIEVVNVSMTGVSSYTLLDLTAGILDQKPDLILIYAGHNEYYGALGVGSKESFGTSRTLINLILYLENYKITQLIRNWTNAIAGLFSSKNKNESSGTLMSVMAKDQYITIDSEKYNAGLSQFNENIADILDMAKQKNVPVIMGTLVSNLKDQEPFISVNTPGYKTADQIYTEAEDALSNNHLQKADSLFKLAKDLDALRFRAPEKINQIIKVLGRKYNNEVVSIDSLFAAESPEKITGDNLITDHLHPNLEGYLLIGKAYYEVMERKGILPENGDPKIPFEKQDSLTRANFMFTELDSVIGGYLVAVLKNDWPFNKQANNSDRGRIFNPESFKDSIAVEYIEKKISWSDACLKAATEYLKKDDIKNYLKYMNVLIYRYPFLKDINTAVRYFYDQGKINPSDYTQKRLELITSFSTK